MKTYFKVRSITAIIFIIVLFGFSAINLLYSGKDILNTIESSIESASSGSSDSYGMESSEASDRDASDSFNDGSSEDSSKSCGEVSSDKEKRINVIVNNINDIVKNIDATINDKILYKDFFIETYGYTQKLMGKNEFSNFDVVKDTNGKLHYTYFAKGLNETKELSDRTSYFAKEMEKQGTKFVYLMTPEKYVKGVTKFPIGIPYPYHNETADNFLDELEENNVDYIDFRDTILNSGIDEDKLFFNTDHHWTIETAFWAFTELINELNEKYSLNLDENNFYRDINNYNSITYPQSYLGSMGRKTGILYGNLDDFTLIYPKFSTNYRYYTDSNSQKFDLSGRFEESLILSYPFNADMDLLDVQSDKYSTYLLGNRPLVQVTNYDNPDGLKVLFVKDSLIVPTAAFFSSMCSQVDLIDPRYYEGDIIEYAKSNNYDFVFLSIYPQNLVEEFFPFNCASGVNPKIGLTPEA